MPAFGACRDSYSHVTIPLHGELTYVLAYLLLFTPYVPSWALACVPTWQGLAHMVGAPAGYKPHHCTVS